MPESPFSGHPGKEGQFWMPQNRRKQSPLGQPFVRPAPPFLTPLLEWKRELCGTWDFQRHPRGPRRFCPGTPAWQFFWAPEKYQWPWLTQLFFRFEPTPRFDSDPAEKESTFRKPRGLSSLVDAASSPQARAAQLRTLYAAHSYWRPLLELMSTVVGFRAKVRLIQHVLKPPKWQKKHVWKVSNTVPNEFPTHRSQLRGISLQGTDRQRVFCSSILCSFQRGLGARGLSRTLIFF